MPMLEPSNFVGIKFVRAICSLFPIHRCILRKMFEFSSKAQIFESNCCMSSHEDEYDGNFLFFDKEGKFLGCFRDADALLIALERDHKNFEEKDFEDIDGVLEKIMVVKHFLLKM